MVTTAGKKILLFIKTPPPLTGATMINQIIAESDLLNRTFDIRTINISYKKEINNTSISLSKSLKVFKYFNKLFWSLLFFNPNLVYFQISPLGPAFYRDCVFIFLIKLFSKPLLLHLHGKGISDYITKSSIKKSTYKWAFRNSYVICLSDHVANDIRVIYSGEPFIVNNGIQFLNSGKSKKIPQKKVSVLFLSNLLISKGILDYLDALEILSKSSQLDFSAKIIGQKADFDSNTLNLEIEKRNLKDRVVYLGPKFGIEKGNELRNCDVFVFPTLNDAMGIVILEAMQASLPVIATREGAIPEIIEDGVTGFLVGKHNPRQIAEKLKILVNNPEVREKMGEAGRKKYLEKYTLEIFESNMKNVLEVVLKKNIDLCK